MVPPGGDQGTTPQMKVQGLSDNAVYNTQVETPGLWAERFAGAFATFRQNFVALAALTPESCSNVHRLELRNQNNNGRTPAAGTPPSRSSPAR